MRIISKFKDYYDSALGYGIDPTLVYLRKEENINNLPMKYRLNSGRNFRSNYDIFVIGFCGNLYSCVRTWKKEGEIVYDQWGEWDKTNSVPIFHYDLDECIEIIEDNERQDWIAKEKVEDFKELIKRTDFINFFQEYKVPTFILGQGEYNLSGPTFIINPRLKDFQFFKVIDAYTAFQEISMYLGGVLPRKEPDTVDVSEACKVHSKGLDSWSFRKKGPNSKKVAKTPKKVNVNNE